MSRKDIVINNLLGGIAWGLGATIGVSLLITLLTIVAHYIDVVPVIGTFISNLIDYILKTNHHLK